MPMIKVNNSLPSFVRWVDEDIIDDAYARIIAKVPEEDLCFAADRIDFSTFDYDDYRDLQTALNRIGLKEEMYKRRGFYNNKTIVKNKIQDFLFSCMNNGPTPGNDPLKQSMDYLAKVTKYEVWVDNPYNVLLNRTVNKGYSEMALLKGAIILVHYMGLIPFAPEHFQKYHRILSYTPYWSFGHEDLDFDWDKDVESFNKANASRKKEIFAQETFIDLVLREKDYETAYNFIKDRDDK